MATITQKLGRKQERELALRGIFQIPFHKTQEDMDNSIEFFLEEMNSTSNIESESPIIGETTGYAGHLISVVVQYCQEIDSLIEPYLKKDWKLERIPNAEKAILRLCIAEMLYLEIPKEIAINEAVELAKLYGDDDSQSYINGILNNFAQEHLSSTDGQIS